MRLERIQDADDAARPLGELVTATGEARGGRSPACSKLYEKSVGNPSVDQRYVNALGPIAVSARTNLCQLPFVRQ